MKRVLVKFELCTVDFGGVDVRSKFWFPACCIFGVFEGCRGRTELKICVSGDLDVPDISFECMLGSTGVFEG